MADLLVMHVCDGCKHLLHPESHLWLSHIRAPLQNLVAEVASVAVLECHIDAVPILEGLVQLYDVFVLHGSQHSNLAIDVRPANTAGRQASFAKLLHGYHLPTRPVNSTPDGTKRAFAQLDFL
eukprot:CAMPEP_0115508746 /NCGR_PEP_ID=MMETSP0271-20121206/72468_1 /TAXON_ID=71861 /ORGANISM="Scrippsiella trochoidea, Strain CCMP3099" /LENGTH=122 /DNA_ID=CAMNT_0002938513 /DNA_START=634 /DNA_END=1002 /DNA_ORIENTATION=-